MQSKEAPTDLEIPAALAPAVRQALAWLNQSQKRAFELTGVLEIEAALAAEPGEPFELGLVLCDGEICAREQVRVQPTDTGYIFELASRQARAIPPLLDPPPGIRRAWLEDVIGKHEFVLLLFYRGLW